MIEFTIDGSFDPLRINEQRLNDLIKGVNKFVVEHFKLKGKAVVELLFFDELHMAEINAKHRGKNDSTDVLSFPIAVDGISGKDTVFKPFDKRNYAFFIDESGYVMLGTIIICPQVAELEAEAYGLTNEYELTELYAHGLLHLLGFDHMEKEDGEYMQKVQEMVLKELGV